MKHGEKGILPYLSRHMDFKPNTLLLVEVTKKRRIS